MHRLEFYLLELVHAYSLLYIKITVTLAVSSLLPYCCNDTNRCMAVPHTATPTRHGVGGVLEGKVRLYPRCQEPHKQVSMHI